VILEHHVNQKTGHEDEQGGQNDRQEQRSERHHETLPEKDAATAGKRMEDIAAPCPRDVHRTRARVRVTAARRTPF
jgi:hypothetical protein